MWLWQSGAVGSVTTSQLQGLRFFLFQSLGWLLRDLVLCGVFHVYPMSAWVSSGFSSFLPLSKNMHCVNNDCVNVCLYGSLQWTGVPSWGQYFWHKLQVHCNPNQDTTVSESDYHQFVTFSTPSQLHPNSPWCAKMKQDPKRLLEVQYVSLVKFNIISINTAEKYL